MRSMVAWVILWSLAACGAPSRPLPELSAVPALDTRLSPDEAYEAIPHRRTVIALESSSLDASERRYVELVFACLDQGIALRVTTMQDFSGGHRDLAEYTSRQDELIGFLQGLEPPPGFAAYHEKVVEAFHAQKAFFVAWHSAGRIDVRSHPDVQSSSHALHAAYGLIQDAVGSRAPGNSEALFDYHCALDFI